MRWAAAHPALTGIGDFDELLDRRRDPEAAPALLAALAALAPADPLAVRVLLQALVPGLVRLSCTVGSSDPDTLDEMITLAWERIATYPATRHGDVAANVLLDVRKRYRQLRELDHPRKRHQRDWQLRSTNWDSDEAVAERLAAVASAEDRALERVILDELRTMASQGVISEPALRVIVQTRILGRTVSELAAHSGISRNTLMSWRFRAERRLRKLPLAG
jgi:DNA-directed RNA polymerase specialized sigma24 family protein